MSDVTDEPRPQGQVTRAAHRGVSGAGGPCGLASRWQVRVSGAASSLARLSWSESAVSFAGQVPVSTGKSAAGRRRRWGAASCWGPIHLRDPPANTRKSWRRPPLGKKLQERQNFPALVSVPLQGERGCCGGSKAGGPASGLWTSLGSVPGRGREPREWHKSRGVAWGGSCVRFRREKSSAQQRLMGV